MCNRTDCAGTWAGPMACARCEEGEMAMHTVITVGRLEALERAERENAILHKMVSAMAENEAQVSNFGRHYDEEKNTRERVLEKYRRQFGWYK